MIYLSGINYESFNDAPGVNCVLFISGCKHQCPQCHNPQSWNFTNGVPLTTQLIQKINDEIACRPYLHGIVLSGGDPMYSAKELCDVWLPKLHIPHNNLWCYSGFTMEEIIQDSDKKQLLSWCNGLTDGLFDINRRDITLKFRGSSNQHIWKKINNQWVIDV